MRVWIDGDECMGAGTCEQIAPEVFHPLPDGRWTVKEHPAFFGTLQVFGSHAPARVPDDLADDVLDAAAECPGECIHVEA